MKITKIWMVMLLFPMVLFSCKKEEGIGGKATITGKVYVKDYNGSFTTLKSEYYSGDEDVYIIYGDEVVFGDRTRTHFDGTYRFEYLRPGTYTIFAYSDDSLGTTQKIPVSKVVEITENKQQVTVQDIVVLN